MISSWNFPITAGDMSHLASSVGEGSLFNRTGGAPAFALGMAQIFSRTLGGERLTAIWYHFAIMFEALFHSYCARRAPGSRVSCLGWLGTLAALGQTSSPSILKHERATRVPASSTVRMKSASNMIAK